MNVGEFLRWFLLSKAIRKFQQVAMVIFVGTILGQVPSPWGVVGALLFFLVYLNTYFYNDLFDYEEDKKKGAVYKEKALVLGYATPKEFLVLMGNLLAISVFLATLWDPLLGFFSVMALILNNIRTHVKDTVLRQILLILVELFNFEAFWNAFYGGAIPTIFIPLFIAYSSLYALGHGVYKLRKKGKLDDIVRSREMRNLIVISILAIIFSLPSLFLSPYHFAFLVLGLLVYTLPMLRLVSRGRMDDQRKMEEVSVNHNMAMLMVSLVLLLGAALYVLYGSPLNVYLPFLSDVNGYYEEFSTHFDKLQAYILDRMFGDVRGLRARYDVNDIQATP
ncbi:MAG: UbiA family prenyltransferase [Candidatus Diapherotrites archaeon]|nr:UbiA family prenyltransferase [Candidatus Diapherotrites archaeon]